MAVPFFLCVWGEILCTIPERYAESQNVRIYNYKYLKQKKRDIDSPALNDHNGIILIVSSFKNSMAKLQ